MKGDQGRDAEKSDADVKDSRRDRLKLALRENLKRRKSQAERENLKRRKSQARGRSDAGASSETADASLDDASGEKPEPVAQREIPIARRVAWHALCTVLFLFWAATMSADITAGPATGATSSRFRVTSRLSRR